MFLFLYEVDLRNGEKIRPESYFKYTQKVSQREIDFGALTREKFGYLNLKITKAYCKTGINSRISRFCYA
jgi:hypothetical protein